MAKPKHRHVYDWVEYSVAGSWYYRTGKIHGRTYNKRLYSLYLRTIWEMCECCNQHRPQLWLLVKGYGSKHETIWRRMLNPVDAKEARQIAEHFANCVSIAALVEGREQEWLTEMML